MRRLTRYRPFALLAAMTPLLAACQHVPPPDAPPAQRARVADLAAFERFIAARPRPEAFRREYPGIVLVLPGEIATKELRGDNSRYFAVLDDQGRIVGGNFR